VKNRPTTLTPAQREALEARFALRVSARLNEGAAALPHDITERLRVAREQAVRAAQPRPVAIAQPILLPTPATAAVLSPAGAGGQPAMIPMPVVHGAGREHGRKSSESPLNWGWKLANVLPVLALVVGMWGVHAWFRAEKVEAATEVDMELLKDDLPPSAYADPGFAEFLREDASNSPVRPLETETVEPDGDLKSEDTSPASATP